MKTAALIIIKVWLNWDRNLRKLNRSPCGAEL